MTNEVQVDVSSILNLLTESNKEQASENGCFYSNESPGVIFSKITYTSGPTQITSPKKPKHSNQE